MRKLGIAATATLALALALTACEDAPSATMPAETDPAVTAALAEQILVDPDLSRQNEGNAALTGGIDHALPIDNATPRTIDAARMEALEMIGGRDRLKPLPPAGPAAAPVPLAARLSVVERTAYAGAPRRCVAALRHDFGWAARMPRAFPLYPRAATQEAVGADTEGCAVRAVHFRTPVAVEDVLAFYHARAHATGFTAAREFRGEEEVLRGERGDEQFAVYARRGPGTSAEIDLVTIGG